MGELSLACCFLSRPPEPPPHNLVPERAAVEAVPDVRLIPYGRHCPPTGVHFPEHNRRLIMTCQLTKETDMCMLSTLRSILTLLFWQTQIHFLLQLVAVLHNIPLSALVYQHSGVCLVVSTSLKFTASALPLNPRSPESRIFASYIFLWMRSYSNTRCCIVSVSFQHPTHTPSCFLNLPTELLVLKQRGFA